MISGFIQDIKLKFKHGSPVVQLIIVNVALFVLLVVLKLMVNITFNQKVFSNIIYYWLGFNLQSYEWIYKPWTILSYMFVHDLSGIFHLLWNMLFLYWFGKIIEEFIGASKVIPIYILGGIFGALVSWGVILLLFTTNVPMPLIGASGAVYAIMISAVVLVPNYRFNLLFFGPVAIKYIALIKLVLDFLNISELQNIGGHICHLGGALFGLLFVQMLRKGYDLSKPFNTFLYFIKYNPKRKKMKVSHRNPTAEKTKVEKIKQQKLDDILDKISTSGYESLSKEEKDFLFKASKD